QELTLFGRQHCQSERRQWTRTVPERGDGSSSARPPRTNSQYSGHTPGYRKKSIIKRGSPVCGALKTIVTVPLSSVSWYSVKRLRRKIDSASGPFSHSMKRSLSASRPLLTCPIQTRVSSPADPSGGTLPAYLTLSVKSGQTTEREANRTRCLCPGGHRSETAGAPTAGDDQPRRQ